MLKSADDHVIEMGQNPLDSDDTVVKQSFTAEHLMTLTPQDINDLSADLVTRLQALKIEFILHQQSLAKAELEAQATEDQLAREQRERASQQLQQVGTRPSTRCDAPVEPNAQQDAEHVSDEPSRDSSEDPAGFVTSKVSTTLFVNAPDMAAAAYAGIVIACREQEKPFQDPDFQPGDGALYATGERDPTKEDSALHHVRVEAVCRAGCIDL